MATRKQTWQKDWQTPQLPSIRLGPDYAWILGALDKLPEGRAEAIRSILRDAMKRKRLDVRHMGKTMGERAVQIPPTRLVAGFEDLPDAISAARELAMKRIGYPIDNADVMRCGLWAGLAARGYPAPSLPVDVDAVVLKEAGKRTHAEIAKSIGVDRAIVLAAVRRLGLSGEVATPLTAAQLKIALDPGLPQLEAAARLGVSQMTISKARATHGYDVDHRSEKITPAQLAIILDTRLSYADAAKSAGVSVTTVGKRRVAAGVTNPIALTAKQLKIIQNTSLTYAEAARRAGVATATVYEHRAAAGLVKSRRKSQE